MLQMPKSILVACVLASSLIIGTMGSALPGLDDDAHWFPTQGQWVDTQMLAPNDAIENMPTSLNFGAAVAIDGDTLVASTQSDKYQDDWFTCPQDDGCDWVYVFNKDQSGDWIQTAKLVPENPEPGDTFGYSVDVDEKSGVIVIGNPGARNTTSPYAPSGAQKRIDQTHIFEQQMNGDWKQTAVFHRPTPKGSSFGETVGVSGNTVISPSNESVIVYEKIEDQWTEKEILHGSTILTISGDTIVTGIRHYVDSDCIRQRTYYQMYNKIDGEWEPTVKLDPQKENGDRAYTGASRLDLSDDEKTLVMGLPVDQRVMGVHTQYCIGALGQYNPGPLSFVGSGWIYEEIGGEWVLTADIPNPTPNSGHTSSWANFGISVGVSENIAVFGAKGDDYTGGGPNSGAVFVYEKVLGEWLLQAKLQNRDPEPQDWFGHSSGVSKGIIVAGADKSSRSGSAHIYEKKIDA